MTIGDRIKKFRLRKGITPAQLAAAAHVTDGTIHLLEGGQTKEPRLSTGLHIARALGVSPYELIGEHEAVPLRDGRENLMAIIDDHERRIAALEKRRSR